MTKRDAVALATRVIAIYLLLWAFDSATYLPARFFALAHYSTAISGGYGSDLERIEIMAGLIRIGTLLVISLLFFRCGSAIQRLLLGPEQLSQGDVRDGFSSTNT